MLSTTSLIAAQIGVRPVGDELVILRSCSCSCSAKPMPRFATDTPLVGLMSLNSACASSPMARLPSHETERSSSVHRLHSMNVSCLPELTGTCPSHSDMLPLLSNTKWRTGKSSQDRRISSCSPLGKPSDDMNCCRLDRSGGAADPEGPPLA